MPLLSPPLSPDQINIIRQWIAQGAHNDLAVVPSSVLEVPDVQRPSNGFLSISCRVLDQAFLGIEIFAPDSKQVLVRKYATAKWIGGYGGRPKKPTGRMAASSLSLIPAPMP